jgi:hypothetical protein
MTPMLVSATILDPAINMLFTGALTSIPCNGLLDPRSQTRMVWSSAPEHTTWGIRAGFPGGKLPMAAWSAICRGHR